MASVYTRNRVRLQLRAEYRYYFLLPDEQGGGEERANLWLRQVRAALQLVAANPHRAGVSVRFMPATHRRIMIGKTHWLYFRIEDDGSVLVYWMHGKSQERMMLPASGLRREATTARKERDAGPTDDPPASELLAAAEQADQDATEYGTAANFTAEVKKRTAKRRADRDAPTEEGS